MFLFLGAAYQPLTQAVSICSDNKLISIFYLSTFIINFCQQGHLHATFSGYYPGPQTFNSKL